MLCGGASRRMGRDKATVEVDGEALAVRVAAVLRAAGCAPVVAVGGDAPALRARGLEVVADRWPGEGPLGGVVTALGHLAPPGEQGVGGVVVVACDLAALDVATVGALAAEWSRARARGGLVDAVVAATDRLEPLCAVWSAHCAAEIERRFVAGTRAVHAVLDDLVVRRVEVGSAALRNVNTPSDLRLLARHDGSVRGHDRS